MVDAGRKVPEVTYQDDHVTVEKLIGEKDTPCFAMTRYILDGGEVTLDTPASIWICVEGEGSVEAGGETRAIHSGDYFFLPAAASGKCVARSDKKMKIVCCVGGK